MVTFTYSRYVQLLYQFLRGKAFNNVECLNHSTDPYISLGLTSGLLDQVLYHLFPRYQLKKRAYHLGLQMDIQKNTILHVHWAYPHGYYGVQIAKKFGVPCVITAHGSDIHTFPKHNRYTQKLTVDAIEQADMAIFVSHSLLNDAKELGYSGNNSVIIPNGLDLSYFKPMTRDLAQKKTGWTQTRKFVVGFVGNFRSVKGVDRIPNIFKNIQKKVSNVEFIMVGNGELEPILRDECKQANLQVTFVGRVRYDMVANWMNLFDVMILPSRNESWGCVVVEAYSCGIPVVASEVGGIPEVMCGAGHLVPDGEYFDERFSEIVCSVLLENNNIDKERLREIASEYTWERCVSNEREIYKICLNKKSNLGEDERS